MNSIEHSSFETNTQDSGLEDLQEQLLFLENELAEKELQLATLEAEIITFERKYNRVVGVYIVELDETEARIAELYLKISPEDPKVQERYEKARERFRVSSEQVGEPEEYQIGKTEFNPSQSIKSIYRKIAKLIHPDLTTDPQERELRTTLMMEVNNAFEEGDEGLLRSIYEDCEKLHSAEEKIKDFKRNRLLRKITQVQTRIKIITNKLVELRASDIFRLILRVKEANINGVDLLSTMAEEIKGKIKERKKTLETLSNQCAG